MGGIHCIHSETLSVPFCSVLSCSRISNHSSLCVHHDSPAIPLSVLPCFLFMVNFVLDDNHSSPFSNLSTRPPLLFLNNTRCKNTLPMYLWVVSLLLCIVKDSSMKCLGWLAFYFLFMHRVWVMKEAPLKMNSRKKLMTVCLLELKVLTEIWLISLTDCSIFC